MLDGRGTDEAGAGVDAALMVRSVRAGYGGRDVLRDVSLAVRRGELVGVIGPNGSGKSTLVRAISRVIPLHGGDVSFGGRAARRMSASEIARQVAVVPQTAALPDEMTGLELVLLGRTPHLRLLQSEGARDIAIARAALALADVGHLAGRRVRETSGGERQRLLIARALAQEPRVLVLDEPTAHLDLSHQVSVFELVRARCRDDGLAVLAVVHDLTLAAQFCDRLILLTGGRIMTEGPPLTVLQPETLSAAYGGRVSVLIHPETGRPVVVPLATGDGRFTARQPGPDGAPPLTGG